MILETSLQYTIPDLRSDKHGTLGGGLQKILCSKYQFALIYPTPSTIGHQRVIVILNGVLGHQYPSVGF